MFRRCCFFCKKWGHVSTNWGGGKSVLDNLVHFRWSLLYSGEGRGRKLVLRLGPGAGYIGGWACWIGIQCKGLRGEDMYKVKPLQLGTGPSPFGYGY